MSQLNVRKSTAVSVREAKPAVLPEPASTVLVIKAQVLGLKWEPSSAASDTVKDEEVGRAGTSV